jgi:hypothetical protein
LNEFPRKTKWVVVGDGANQDEFPGQRQAPMQKLRLLLAGHVCHHAFVNESLRKQIMRKTIVLGMLFGLLSVTHNSVAADENVDAKGWQVLFDGKNLDAWNRKGQEGVWAITDQGELYPAKRGRSIFTKKRYCDFVLELDFKMGAKAKANSGVFLHVHKMYDEVNTGMEIQILDNADYHVKWNAGNANGALYDLVHPAVDANKPIGEWNHYRITLNANLLTVELNGQEIVRADLDRWTKAHTNPDGSQNKFPHAIGALPREGFIGLQNYGGTPVWFRNIRLKLLSDRQPRFTGAEPIEQVLGKPGRS